jgi:hypothetical protein
MVTPDIEGRKKWVEKIMKNYVFIALVCLLLLAGIAAAAVEPMQVGTASGNAGPLVTIAPDATSGIIATALPAPVQISPANYITLTHWPRQTTLVWQPVIGATSYKVERYYLSGSTWVKYPDVTVTGQNNAFYTFTFVGDQYGAWRVTALGAAGDSAPSAWWYFTYQTKPALPTPATLQPSNNAQFIGYPRTTYLKWNPVPGATGYQVERAYYDGTWHAYPVVTLNGTSYTFNFVGDQWGRWRVTALSSSVYFYDSAPSAWMQFHWSSASPLQTPVLVSPANNIDFYHYPRTTTLTWNRVPGATGYKVETQYYSGSAWYAWNTYTPTTDYYTFNFVGSQPGRWRVTATGASVPFANSYASNWRNFTYHI